MSMPLNTVSLKKARKPVPKFSFQVQWVSQANTLFNSLPFLERFPENPERIEKKNSSFQYA